MVLVEELLTVTHVHGENLNCNLLREITNDRAVVRLPTLRIKFSFFIFHLFSFAIDGGFTTQVGGAKAKWWLAIAQGFPTVSWRHPSWLLLFWRPTSDLVGTSTVFPRGQGPDTAMGHHGIEASQTPRGGMQIFNQYLRGRIISRPSGTTEKASDIMHSSFWNVLRGSKTLKLNDAAICWIFRECSSKNQAHILAELKNCNKEGYSLAGRQQTLDQVDPEPQAFQMAEEQGPVCTVHALTGPKPVF